MRWFRENTDGTTAYTDDQARAVIQKYVSWIIVNSVSLSYFVWRYIDGMEAEMEELKKDEKKNLWKISVLQTSISKTSSLFEESGYCTCLDHPFPSNRFWLFTTAIPDITAKKVRRALHEDWDGNNAEFLEKIRMRSFKKVSERDPNEIVSIPKVHLNQETMSESSQ